MLAIGVGGADAVDALTGTPWELKAPKIIGQYAIVYVRLWSNASHRYPSHWADERLDYS